MAINENTVSLSGLIRFLEKYKDKGVVDMFVKHADGGNEKPITSFGIEEVNGKNAKLIVKDY